MTKFENNNILLHAACEEVFDFLADFRNFKSLLPDQVTNWQAGETHCSFTVRGMSDLSMRSESKRRPEHLSIVSEGKNPADFRLDFHISRNGEDGCRVSIVFDVDLSPFAKMLASKPLNHLVDTMGKKLRQRFG